MSILENIKGLFKTQEVTEVVEVKATEELGNIIAPIFREIPPNSKAEKFLVEGTRSWAFIAMSAIADEISTTDMGLFKKNQQGEYTEVLESQILSVLQKPNQFQTKEELFWLMTMYLLAEGEAPLLLNNSKNPTEIVLLKPEKIKIIYDESNTVGKYTYSKSNGEVVDIDKDLIIFLKIPSFSTPFRGMGIMRYIAQTLDIDNYLEEYLRIFFWNDATPGSVLETEQTLKKSSYNRLKNQLKEKHQGYKKAHKNLILENGLKWKEVGMKISELQIKELQNEIRDKILAAFKVPKSVLGIVEDVNRANAEVSDLVFSKRCIYPKLKLIEAQLNNGFVSKFSGGEQYYLEFDNPIREDQKLQAEIDVMYINSGVLTVDEVRTRMELQPIEEVEEVEEPEEPIEPEEETEPDGKFVDIMKDFVKKEEPRSDFTQKELETFHKEKIMFMDKIEEEYKEDLKKFFNKQEKRILSNVKGLDFDKETEAKAIADLTIPYLNIVVEKESELAFALVGFSGRYLSSQDDLVKKFIQLSTIKLGKETAKTTEDAVNRIFNEWQSQEDPTTAGLKRLLKDYFEDNKRADMIARTELSRAAGFAQEEVYKETGAVGKEWLTAVDERVCEFCSEMDRKVVKINDNFWGKGETMVGGEGGTTTFDYGDVSFPPLHPNCRCDLIPVYNQIRSQDYKAKNQKKLDKIKQEQENLKSLEVEKEKLKEKEKEIKSFKLKLKKDQAEQKKKQDELIALKEQAEKELKEVQAYNKKLNGKVK